MSTELSSGIVNLLLIAVGLAIGLALGLIIASRMEVKIDEQGRMILKGSTVAVLIWAVIIVLKIYGKELDSRLRAHRRGRPYLDISRHDTRRNDIQAGLPVLAIP